MVWGDGSYNGAHPLKYQFPDLRRQTTGSLQTTDDSTSWAAGLWVSCPISQTLSSERTRRFDLPVYGEHHLILARLNFVLSIHMRHVLRRFSVDGQNDVSHTQVGLSRFTPGGDLQKQYGRILTYTPETALQRLWNLGSSAALFKHLYWRCTRARKPAETNRFPEAKALPSQTERGSLAQRRHSCSLSPGQRGPTWPQPQQEQTRQTWRPTTFLENDF